MSKGIQGTTIVLALFASACSQSPSPPPIAWAPSYPLALEAANDSGKPMLLYFSAEWCSICRRMEAEGLADAGVRDALLAYVVTRIDVDRQAWVAEKYNIQAVPALVVIGQGEKVRRRIHGLRDAAELLHFLQY